MKMKRGRSFDQRAITWLALAVYLYDNMSWQLHVLGNFYNKFNFRYDAIFQ